MAINYARARFVADRQIKKFGALGQLQRGDATRDCWCCIVEYSPREQQLRMKDARRAVISALNLDPAPDYELDVLIFNGQVHRIVTPVKSVQPAGIIVLYECEVVYASSNV